MPFSLREQLRLLSPSLFEELCAQLVKCGFAESHHVEGSGGDRGLDIFDGDLDQAGRLQTGRPLRVWQVKYFRDGVKQPQRKQAEESLARVWSTYQPAFWTLCVPVNLDPNAEEWFEALRAQYPKIKLSLMAANEIVRQLLSDKNKSLLDTYFLRHKPAIQEAVMNSIVERLDDFTGVPELLEKARSSVATTPRNATDFYNGTIPDWRDIVQSFDALREKFGELWRFVVACANKPAGRVPFALITGRSGDGKSTVLMRLAAELIKQEHKLVFYHKDDRLSLRAEQLCDLPSDKVSFVLIDKIPRFDADALRGFFERLYRAAVPVVVIGAAVRSIWEGLNVDLANVADVCEVGVEEMTDGDIETLLDKLSADPVMAEEYLGALAGLTRKKQVTLFRKKANRQLLVALLESKRNKSFEAYISGELEQLSSHFGIDVRRACIFVSALHRFDLPMPHSLLHRLLPNAYLDDEVLQRTHGLLTELLPKKTGIITRHALVAEVIFAADGQAKQRYEGIINAAEPDHDRLIGRVIQFLILRDERVLAEDLLRIACHRFPANVVLINMQALLSLQRGDDFRARHLLARAAELEPTSVHTWNTWAILEKEQNNLGTPQNPEPNTARWLFAKAAEVDPANLHTWNLWARLEKEQNNIGVPENPEPNTARWLFARSAEVHPKNVPTWVAWAMLEKEQNNIGNQGNPAPNTARWLFAQSAEANPTKGYFWNLWATFEREQGNIGANENPEPGSARWLFAKAAEVEPKHPRSSYEWAILEKEQNNIGTQEHPEPNTARWLFAKAAEVEPKHPRGWYEWAILEKEQNNIGTQHNPELNTARWLFAKAVEVDSKQPHSWILWAILEKEQNNVGTQQNPEPNTARWLFAKAAKVGSEHPHSWIEWAILEKEQNNVGTQQNPEPNTARWLYAKAAEVDPKHSHSWIAWAILEKEQNNIGNQQNPEPNTVRWLLARALQRDPENVYTLNTWALLEKEQNNIGTRPNPESNSARWLFAKSAEVAPKMPHTWQAWAILEKEQNNIGNQLNPEPNTARWLFARATEVGPKSAHSWNAWAILEREQNNIGNQQNPEPNTARWLFAKSAEIDPKDARIWNAWAILEKEQNNLGTQQNPEPNSARWMFAKAAEVDPNAPHTWNAWADMEKDVENWPDAERLYLNAIEVSTEPRDRARMYFDMGFMFSRRRLDIDAVKYFELAVDAYPDDSIAQAKLARSLAFLNRWGDAEKHFQRALELKPDDWRTKQWYQNMQRARRRQER